MLYNRQIRVGRVDEWRNYMNELIKLHRMSDELFYQYRKEENETERVKVLEGKK